MRLIHGRTITLIERTENGVNAFGEPIMVENSVQVENVIIQPTEADDINTQMQLYGRHSVYTLHIPKGDSHNWLNSFVILGGEFGTRKYKQFADIKTYQEELVPLDWNKKVMVEVYE